MKASAVATTQTSFQDLAVSSVHFVETFDIFDDVSQEELLYRRAVGNW